MDQNNEWRVPMNTPAPQIFKFEGWDIRTLLINSEPWWALPDICKALDISNVGNVAARLDEDEKGIRIMDTPGGPQETTIINEPGLYEVILASRKPEAKAFKRWIKHEVLPQIRQTGTYFPEGAELEVALNNPNFIKALLDRVTNLCENQKKLEAQMSDCRAEIELQSAEIACLKPKANYFDTILSAKGGVEITIIASDYGMSGQQMNKLLHDLKIQYPVVGRKSGKTWVLYNEYKNEGYTTMTVKVIKSKDGAEWAKPYMVWTQKGRIFLYEELKKRGILPLCERNNND